MAVAALITWVITAGLGFFMLGTWISNGGARNQALTRFPAPLVFGHFGLAAAGLVVWIVYVINDASVLAWIAFVDLLLVAIGGDVLVLRWSKDRRAQVDGAVAESAERRGAALDAAAEAAPNRLAEQQIPVPAVLLHGVFAGTTIVLVLLAALEIG